MEDISLLDKLEQPRFQECSFFPYSLNENGEVAILFRNKKDSKCSDLYMSFGTSLKDCDANIIFSAARSYVTKSFGLFVQSEVQHLSKKEEIEKKVKEFNFKSEEDVYTNPKALEVVISLMQNQSHAVMEVFAESHLAIFYPISFFKVDLINLVLQENEKYVDLSYKWISLADISNPDFSQQNITSMEYQIISFCAEKLISNLIHDKSKEQYKKPDYAILLTDDRDVRKGINEVLFFGQLYNSGEQWAFYKPNEYEFPTDEELKTIKGIIVPGSKYSAYDESISWLEPTRIFLKKAHEKYPHIKILGVCFGCQIVAQALGGKVEHMKQNLQGKPIYIGKENVNVEKEFFEIPYVKSVIPVAQEQLILHEVHGDHVTVLPEKARLFGSSDRTTNELWTLGDSVLCMQGHPEFNGGFIQEQIVKSLYEVGKLDDNLKGEALELLYDRERGLNRNLILKIIHSFMHQQ